jgi:hypothetical protein
MDPAITDFHFVVRQVDLARPDAPMKTSEFQRALTLVCRGDGSPGVPAPVGSVTVPSTAPNYFEDGISMSTSSNR